MVQIEYLLLANPYVCILEQCVNDAFVPHQVTIQVRTWNRGRHLRWKHRRCWMVAWVQRKATYSPCILPTQRKLICHVCLAIKLTRRKNNSQISFVTWWEVRSVVSFQNYFAPLLGPILLELSRISTTCNTSIVPKTFYRSKENSPQDEYKVHTVL